MIYIHDKPDVNDYTCLNQVKWENGVKDFTNNAMRNV